MRYLNGIWSENNNFEFYRLYSSCCCLGFCYLFSPFNRWFNYCFRCENEEFHSLRNTISNNLLWASFPRSLSRCLQQTYSMQCVTSSSIFQFKHSTSHSIWYNSTRYGHSILPVHCVALQCSLFIDSSMQTYRIQLKCIPVEIYYVIDFKPHDLLPTPIQWLDSSSPMTGGKINEVHIFRQPLKRNQ